VTESALDEYLLGIDEPARPTVRALDAAVRAARPDFDVAVKYRMLLYTVDRKWRAWVAAVGTTKDAVQLRFLWGVLLDDPLRVLRAGSSTLMTWGFPYGAAIDPAAVGGYVGQALATREEFLANADEISAAARERARNR
jgi:hypothetical protein